MNRVQVLYVAFVIGFFSFPGCGSEEGELHPPWPPIEEEGVGPAAAYRLGGASGPTHLGGGPEAFRKDSDADSARLTYPDTDASQSTD